MINGKDVSCFKIGIFFYKKDVMKIFKDLMVQATLWSGIFYAMSYPYIHLFLMKQINEKMVSVNQIFTCLCVIIINSVWNKYSDKLYKYFGIFMFGEGFLYLILKLSIIFNIASPITYYAVDTLLFGLITRNIICGANKLRSKIYKGEQREKYDNTIQIAGSIATLIGAGIAVVIELPIQGALFIGWLAISLDNLLYWIAYKKSINA